MLKILLTITLLFTLTYAELSQDQAKQVCSEAKKYDDDAKENGSEYQKMMYMLKRFNEVLCNSTKNNYNPTADLKWIEDQGKQFKSSDMGKKLLSEIKK